MKHILLILFSFLFLPLHSQTTGLSVAPNPAERTFQVDLTDPDLDLEVHTEVKNTSADTMKLIWRRYEIEQPAPWLTQVCDINYCYNPNVSTNYDPEAGLEELVILPPDSAFTLILHILPNGQSGGGSFDLDFALLDSPDQIIETIVFEADVQGITTSRSAPSVETIRLYPNPTIDYFELNYSGGVDQLVLYNILGRRVRTFRVESGKRYYLNDLPDGMYLASLISRRSGIIKTMRLSKRSLKP